MDLGMTDRRVLMTGATGGMGRETAKILAEAGAKLTLTDIDGDAVRKVAESCGATGVSGDLSSKEGVDNFISEVGTDFDCLIHLAGVTGAKGDPMTMEEDDWHEALNVDFLSAVRLVRHLGPSMVDRGWGRMVFVTSENVAQPYVDETVYNAAKSALLSFAKSVALAHADKGLLVNCVAPAFIETPMTDGMMEKRAEQNDTSVDEAIQSFLDEERPFLKLGRRGKPEEVAPVIAFLASELSSYVTGANWRVDGGSVGSINV